MLRLDDLADLVAKHGAALKATVREFTLGGREFRFNTRPAIMGVVNLSADSWYRESVCLSAEMAIRRAEALHAQGAEIIDIGAESTLAHAARVDDSAQQSKLLPIIRALKEREILVSVETYSASITRAALEAGASVVNLTGGDRAEEVYRMVSDHDAAVILCYVQGRNVREVGDFKMTEDPTGMMMECFQGQVEAAEKSGVKKILIDPGLGFYYRNLQDSAVRVRHQMNIFLNTFRLRALGYPVCHALPHAFEFFGEEVRSAEPYFAVLAALGKTDLFRTHEVAKTRAVLDTLAAF